MAGRISMSSFVICFLIIIIFVLVGFVYVVFWLVVVNSGLKIHVVDASLTQFNLTTNTNNRNILSYNLTLDIQLRNPSKTVGIRYRGIRAAAIYKSKRLPWITFPPFYQGHKNTTILHSVLFQGETLLLLGKSELEDFNKDQRLGRFGITIEFYLYLTLKFGALKFGALKFRGDPIMLCDLMLPLSSYNGIATATGGFKTKECSPMAQESPSF